MNKCTINDIALNIGSGMTPLRSNMEFWNSSDYPWLKTEQLGTFQIYDTEEYISKAAFEQTTIKLWPPKTISVAMYGEGQTRGKVSIIMKEMTTNQACCNIVVNPDVADYRYVYYWLKNNYEQLRVLSSGVRKNLNSNDIKNFPIYVPDLPVQEQIVNVLYVLDKKIELNNRIITELEEMAKTIFDYWFVQFDFPNSKGKPYRSSGGKMVWNKKLKREIPKGWEIKHLSEIESNIITGKTPSTRCPENFNGDIPFITIGDIRNNVFVVSTEITLSQIGADSQPTKYIPEDSICVTCIASPGLVGFATELSQTNQQINTVVCEDSYNKYYLFFSLKNHFKYSTGAKVGSTFANMNKDDFSSIEILKPDTGIMEQYHKIAEPLFQKIKKTTLENKNIRKLRDWLLPMLMNGQVTVE